MRLEQLTFTRFLAALGIVIFHYGITVSPFSSESVSFFFRHANIGVSYFFLLSGFVMMIAYGNKKSIEPGEYFKKRLARIYPVYFLALLLLFVYIFLFFGEKNYDGIVLNALLLQAWIPGKALSFNPLGWTLSVEIFFYALFPFLYNFIYSKIKFKWLAVGIVGFWLISQIIFQMLFNSSFYPGYPSNAHDFIYYFPLFHLSQFLLGNVVGWMVLKKFSLKERNYDIPILLCAVLLFFILKYPFGFNYHNGLMAVVFVPFLLFLAANTGFITKLFNTKPLMFLGEISYGIYILQFPMYLLVDGVLKYFQVETPTRLFYCLLIVLIGAASVSYLFIETPLRKMMNKISFKKFF